jgi:hypothetical protein
MSLNVRICEVMVYARTQVSHEALMRDAGGLVKERANYLGLRYGPG